jgi:hypothetical protein
VYGHERRHVLVARQNVVDLQPEFAARKLYESTHQLEDRRLADVVAGQLD